MHLDTTLGPLSLPERGCILPHEHVFVDLRTSDQPGYAQADPEAVVGLMGPEIERARAAGVVAIVEPGGIGVGRRVDLLLALSRATQFPLVAPTGVYREPWLPSWVREASEADLAEWMECEFTGEIEGTGVRAGWIKVGASDEGLTAAEAKLVPTPSMTTSRRGTRKNVSASWSAMRSGAFAIRPPST